MEFNFDQVIERVGTRCVKWDSPRQLYGREDLIPLSVADMDFVAPPEVTRALLKRIQHPVYGYSLAPTEAIAALVDWIWKRHQWKVEAEWVQLLGGVVDGLALAVMAFTNPGDKVIVQSPVYRPFYQAITTNGCHVVTNPLKLEAGRYVMDLEDLEKKIDGRTKLLFLCNPHNPGGRVWTKRELEALAQLCAKHGVIIVSDDIHSDFVYTGHNYTPIASLSEEISQFTVTCMAPSKTFNLAGLSTAAVIIENPKLRQTFANRMEAVGAPTNLFGIVAMEAAYRHGEPWLEALLKYLQENRDFVAAYIEEYIPGIKVMQPEGTYLSWLECSQLSLAPDKLHRYFVEEAGVVLNDGQYFGPGGDNYLRLNFACPRPILQEALERMAAAAKKVDNQQGD